ncbi:hypothetical protein NLK61_14335 [Pseudomonas fuscovaginae UPB0736]|uniref:hypothetical protein n=1 Tax=Pseudomonas asplenii TaxID=53407 RepID=UPI00037FDF75|nr:hypothetical protein [Pseudomonas fuscovaginae]UUQ67754.1 hypothetical protein NLK61_14335 [Pseudomonas fuscovaginae UPB0736]
MSKDSKSARYLSVQDVLEVKRQAQLKLLAELHAADRESLELAGQYLKAALRGQGPISRPKRFNSAGNKP